MNIDYFILVRAADEAMLSQVMPTGRPIWVKDDGEPMRLAVYPTLELAQECQRELLAITPDEAVRIHRIGLWP